MKKIYFFSIVFFELFLKGNCQIFDNCSTIAPDTDPFNSLPDSVKSYEKGGAVQIATIKIFTYIIKQSGCQGFNAVTPEEVEIAIAKMEVQYNSISPNHMICFYSIGNDVICDDDAYSFSDNSTDDDFNTLVNCCSHIDAITIFFLPKNTPGFGGRANDIPGKSLVINGSLINGPYGVLAHEMGHCLGLFHTFQSNDCPAVSPVNPDCPGFCHELVNSTNCSICGDFVCDTEADYYGSQTDWSSTLGPCFYGGTGVLDLNGDTFSPDISNIMSYGAPQCLNHFTAGQGDRMFSFINGNYSLSIKVVPQDVIMPMISLSDIYIPLITIYGVGGARATNNSVVATKSITAGGQYNPYEQTPQYGGVDNVTFIAGESITLKHIFRASGTFRASIENKTCTPASKRIGHFQSDNINFPASPQLESFNSKSKLSIVPNPSASGVFSVSGLPFSLHSSIAVYTVLGEKIYEKRINANPEKIGASLQIDASPNEQFNQSAIDISTHPRGIYFVKITTGGEISVQKIVFQ